MPSDFNRARYILPKFRPGSYAAMMKTIQNSLTFDLSDIAKYRLHVLDHMEQFGYRSAMNAFGVKKSTLYDWRKVFLQSQKRIFALVPKSTRPKKLRRMQIDPQILLFIKAVREQYGQVGKKKLKLLVDEYAVSIGKKSLGTTAIEKIIRRNHWTFPGKRKWKRRGGLKKTHQRYAPKKNTPGYIEMDSITIFVMSKRHCFITAIDVVTRFAWCKKVSGLTAKNARETFEAFKEQYSWPIRCVQTDNGSEFLGEFHANLEGWQIKHIFIYPRSPRINGVVERFNRTIQEEFLNRCDTIIYDEDLFCIKLNAYLSWYNTKRPHASLGYVSPASYQIS